MKRAIVFTAVVAAAALATGVPVLGAARAQARPTLQVTVLTSGLENPRGLAFGPDGRLYVAEGGTGGTASTVGQCPQVPGAGPYTGGMTARISRIDVHTGHRTTVVDGLPSSTTSAAVGSFVAASGTWPSSATGCTRSRPAPAARMVWREPSTPSCAWTLSTTASPRWRI